MITPTWRYTRTFVHGDLAGINPFSHRKPAPVKVIVKDGQIQEGMETAFQAANPDGLELTPPSRRGAIFRTEPAKSTRPRKPVEVIREVESPITLPEAVEPEYIPIDEIIRQDSALDPDEREYEEGMELLKAA